VDSEQTRTKKEYGPGEGFPWSDVDFNYSVEWANGMSNEDSPGKVVYIPQNFLYEMSGKRDEIKNKILPVLTKKLPQIGSMHSKVVRDIDGLNEDISEAVRKWFQEKKQIESISEGLRELGAKTAVQAERSKIDEEIKGIKEKFKLKAADIKQLKKLSEKVSGYEQRISEIGNEIERIGDEGRKGEYFTKSEISLTPALDSLPGTLKEKLQKELEALSIKLVGDANKVVSVYITSIEKELMATEKNLETAFGELNVLNEKQEKNEELEGLIKKSGELKTTNARITSETKRLNRAKKRLGGIQKDIAAYLKQRAQLISELIKAIEAVDQGSIKDMSFGIEAEVEQQDIENLSSMVDTRANTDFVSSRNLSLPNIRSNSKGFLEAIYSGDQKINRGYDSQSVGIVALTLTENILFTAYMEGDRIGGFSEPTMTPGKRALFALRLMLAESEDTWPLLIDQPEDDLDSRSIFDDIVPFLREKKRERQIIMVSHNANLVIGADSEQIVVANRHGEDRKNEDGLQFNYLSGSIENKKDPDPSNADTLKSQGIREHACQILEGGELAFEQRSNRYDIRREEKTV
jgi:DNA repair exonuclease SbcCD ATPase subunit